MKKLYRISSYAGDQYAYIQDSILDLDLSYELLFGNKIQLSRNQVQLKRTSKLIPDIIGNGSTEFLVNGKVKKILKEYFSGKVNYISVKIDKYEYWLINLIGHLDCFDYENSDYTVFDNGKPDKITKLKLHTEKIPEIALFRIKEKPIPLFVTEKLKGILEEAKITGAHFNEDMNLTVGI